MLRPRDSTMLQDKRLTGEQNVLATLTYLHRFGWLTSRMLAALVWPDASQSQAMARRTLKSLCDDKRVLKRAFPEGGDCYVLSARGARWLNENAGIVAKGGASLQLGNPVHRACSNWYLIHRLLDDETVWTEYEIQTGRAPVFSVAGKTPDGLVETPFGLLWIEVENAWKNRLERAKVVQFCSQCLFNGNNWQEIAHDEYLFRVAIVSTNQNALRAMFRSFIDAHASGEISCLQIDFVELALCPIDKSLNPGLLHEALLSEAFERLNRAH